MLVAELPFALQKGSVLCEVLAVHDHFYLITFQFSPLHKSKEQHYCNKVLRLVETRPLYNKNSGSSHWALFCIPLVSMQYSSYGSSEFKAWQNPFRKKSSLPLRF
jgi:hypothetical protein